MKSGFFLGKKNKKCYNIYMKSESQYIAENIKLRKRIQELERMLFIANQKINEQNKEILSLREQLDIKSAKIFAPSTETESFLQIDEAEGILEEEKKEIRLKKSVKKKKRYSVDELENKVSRIEYIDPEEKVCPKCGEELVEASSSISYKLVYHKGFLEVVKVVRRNYKCPRCNGVDNKLYSRKLDDPFPRSLMTPSLAAFILNTKFVLGVPFERISNFIMEKLGVPMSKQVLAHAAEFSALLLSHIVERMKEDLLSAQAIHADETTLVISRKPESDKDRKKSYMFVYLPSFYSPYQMAIYSFNKTRSIGKTKELLEKYNGYLICDDYAGYKSIANDNPNIKLQYCFSHARRRFVDILKSMKQENRKGTVSYQMVSYIDQIFEMERKYRKEGLTPDEILEHRKTEHPPILNKIEKLMKETVTQPGTSLDRAMSYIRDNFVNMKTYLESGYVEVSNNAAERCVKPFVVLRKVFQTCGSYDGASFTGDLFTLIRSAMINGLDPQAYLEYCLCHYADTPVENLLPYHRELKEKFPLK